MSFDECMKNGRGESLTGWVIRLMHRYSSANFKKFTELGIHPGQLPVLKILYSNEGLNMREMARMLHIKPPTVTVTVQRLEKSGLVQRQADAGDQRISRIFLTEKGRQVNEEIEKVIEENEQLLTKGFSPEEIRQVCEFFRRMTENLAQEGNDPGGASRQGEMRETGARCVR